MTSALAAVTVTLCSSVIAQDVPEQDAAILAFVVRHQGDISGKVHDRLVKIAAA